MATDLLLEALANQRKQAESNNLWNVGSQALGSISQSYAANQDPYSDPNDNLIGALIAGLGSGMAKGFGQRQVRQEMADYSNTLRGVAKDYYTGGDLSGYYNSPYESISEIAPSLEFSRSANEFQRTQKLEDERAKRTLDFGFDMQAKGYNVGKDETGNLIYRANPSYGQAQAELDQPKALLDLSAYKEKKLIDFDMDSQRKQMEDQAFGGAGSKKVIELEDSYRKEFNALPQVKEFQVASKGFESVLAASKRDNRVTDQELVRGAVQASEPGLAVREGEYAAVQKSEGFLPALKQSMLSALDGRSGLTADQRQEIIQWTARRYSGHKDQYDSAKNYYGSRLSQFGSTPDALEVLPSSYPEIKVDQKSGTSFQIIKDANGRPIGKKPL